MNGYIASVEIREAKHLVNLPTGSPPSVQMLQLNTIANASGSITTTVGAKLLASASFNKLAKMLNYNESDEKFMNNFAYYGQIKSAKKLTNYNE